jgi:glycosyltransferase involved in cell wall biosynthesis
LFVVSDGSIDGTAEIAQAEGAEVIELEQNQGKSAAIAVGARACKQRRSTIMVMLAADLRAVESRQLALLISPLIRSDLTDMVFGTVRGDLTGLSGQRAIRIRALGPLVCNSATWRKKLSVAGYGLEVALHYLLKRQEIAPTEFDPARAAEGKNLGVKAQVDATNLYFTQRDGLAYLLRQKRRQIASLSSDQRRQANRRLHSQAEYLERQCYRELAAGVQDGQDGCPVWE